MGNARGGHYEFPVETGPWGNPNDGNQDGAQRIRTAVVGPVFMQTLVDIFANMAINICGKISRGDRGAKQVIINDIIGHIRAATNTASQGSLRAVRRSFGRDLACCATRRRT